MPSHFFDAIVVGDDTAGLVAGALLAKRGYRVMQVDCRAAPGSYLLDGYPFPCGPALLPLIEGSRVMSGVMRELALSGQTYHGMGLSVGRFQTLLPGHRLDIWHDRAMLLREFHREFLRKKTILEGVLPEQDGLAKQTADFISGFPALPPLGFWEGRRLGREAQRFPDVVRGHGVPRAIREDPVLLRALCSPVDFVAMSEGSLAHPAGALTLASVLRGGWLVAQSREKPKAMLKKRLRELGGILIPAPKPARLHADGSRLRGLTLSDSTHTYNCANVVAAAPVSEIAGLVPEGRRARKVSALVPGVESRLCAMTVNLVAPSSSVPQGMGPAVFLASDPASDGEASPVFVAALPVVRNKVAQRDETLLSATMIVSKARLRRDRARAIAELKAEILGRMARPFPFVVEKAAIISTPWDAERMSDAPGQPLQPDEYQPPDLCRAAGRLAFGLCALPATAGFENLFFASRQNFPGLGIEGEFFAGCTIANHIMRLNPRKA
jgi:phytoene dehydrogenase-like protein